MRQHRRAERFKQHVRARRLPHRHATSSTFHPVIKKDVTLNGINRERKKCLLPSNFFRIVEGGERGGNGECGRQPPARGRPEESVDKLPPRRVILRQKAILGIFFVQPRPKKTLPSPFSLANTTIRQFVYKLSNGEQINHDKRFGSGDGNFRLRRGQAAGGQGL